MGRPFWTTGPVPTALLADLAIPRTRALADALATLAAGRAAHVGGPPGWGRTTFLLQVLAAAGRPALLVDVGALLQGTEEEALAAGAQQVGLRGVQSWEALLSAVGPNAVLALDGT